jgi:hypothetical protein
VVSAAAAGTFVLALPAHASDAPAAGGMSAAQLQAHLGQRAATPDGVGEQVTPNVGCGKNCTADLGVQVTADANPNVAGDQDSRTGSGPITWTVTATNNGPDTYEDGTLTDTLPSAAKDSDSGLVVTPYFVTGTTSAGTQCQFPSRFTQVDGQQVKCTLPDLAAGEQATVTFEVVVSHRQAQANPTFSFTDKATVPNAKGDNDTSNDSDSATATYQIR